MKRQDSEESIPFYGPYYLERSEEDVVDEVEEIQRGNSGYILVEETHEKHSKYPYFKGVGVTDEQQFANMCRDFFLTFKEQRKNRQALHFAALNGDKHFCKFIIEEAINLGILS
jgi:hypothetical protein